RARAAERPRRPRRGVRRRQALRGAERELEGHRSVDGADRGAEQPRGSERARRARRGVLGTAEHDPARRRLRADRITARRRRAEKPDRSRSDQRNPGVRVGRLVARPAQRIWRGAVGRVRTARRLLLTLDSPRDKLARQESGRTSMRALSLALSVAMIAAMPSSQAASYFTVTSKSIKDGARIPARFAADDPKRPCRPGSTEICPCPGQNVSPQLAWTNAPAGTR